MSAEWDRKRVDAEKEAAGSLKNIVPSLTGLGCLLRGVPGTHVPGYVLARSSAEEVEPG